MRNKYSTTFTSQNDTEQKFTLTFAVEGGKHIHVLDDVTLYQHRSDTFATLKNNTSKHSRTNQHHFTATTIYDGFQFTIDIIVAPQGAEVFVIERVITIITHQPNLQPCN